MLDPWKGVQMWSALCWLKSQQLDHQNALGNVICYKWLHLISGSNVWICWYIRVNKLGHCYTHNNVYTWLLKQWVLLHSPEVNFNRKYSRHQWIKWVWKITYSKSYPHFSRAKKPAWFKLAGANGVSAGSSLARLRHRWWKVRSFLRGKFSAVDGTA